MDRDIINTILTDGIDTNFLDDKLRSYKKTDKNRSYDDVKNDRNKYNPEGIPRGKYKNSLEGIRIEREQKASHRKGSLGEDQESIML